MKTKPHSTPMFHINHRQDGMFEVIDKYGKHRFHATARQNCDDWIFTFQKSQREARQEEPPSETIARITRAAAAEGTGIR